MGHSSPPPSALAVSLVVALAAAPIRPASAAEDVTLYRCTGADGTLALRSTPCQAGERQQRIRMLRPKDPPPRPEPQTPAPAPVAAPVPPTTRVILIERPPPLYECTTADGDTYTSNDGAGNPRWVPLWTLGYPAYPPHARPRPWPPHPRAPVIRRSPLEVPVRPAASRGMPDTGLVFDGIGRPAPPPPADPQRTPGLPPAVGLAYTPGSWIHDSCRPLSPAEACQHLRDRHWELGRRYNSALQSEREQIDAAQDRLNAQMEQQCLD